MALGNGFFSRLFGKNKEEDDFFTEYAIEMDEESESLAWSWDSLIKDRHLLKLSDDLQREKYIRSLVEQVKNASADEHVPQHDIIECIKILMIPDIVIRECSETDKQMNDADKEAERQHAHRVIELCKPQRLQRDIIPSEECGRNNLHCIAEERSEHESPERGGNPAVEEHLHRFPHAGFHVLLL